MLFVKEIYLHLTGLSVFSSDVPIQHVSHFSTLVFKEEKFQILLLFQIFQGTRVFFERGYIISKRCKFHLKLIKLKPFYCFVTSDFTNKISRHCMNIYSDKGSSCLVPRSELKCPAEKANVHNTAASIKKSSHPLYVSNPCQTQI